MKKHWIIVMLMLILLSLASSTYAWFTYVQRKSFVSFVSNDISYSFEINDEPVMINMLIDDLVYVDFEDDILHNHANELENILSIQTFEIKLSPSAPYVKVEIDIEGFNALGLIAVIVMEDRVDTFDFHTYLLSIIDPLQPKDLQMASIHAHNESMILILNEKILSPGESLIYEMYLLGDYDQAEEVGDYRLLTYDIYITLRLSTNLGD